LFGLLAEGLGFGAAPAYTALAALGTAAGLSGAAHLMMRTRRRATDAV
jgi:hypothetical protein